MFVPEPVIRVAVNPSRRADADKMGKALQRFRKEDPTFQVMTDEESGETLIAGMGELHLEVYIERIRREYKVDIEVGAPKVSYRESPTIKAELRFQAQETDRRFRPICPHRRCPGAAAGGRDRDRSNSRSTSSAAGFPRNTFRPSRRAFAASVGKGPLAGYPDHRREGPAGRWVLPRRRQ